jgi:hypothetical protein
MPEVMRKAFEVADYAEDVLLKKFVGLCQASSTALLRTEASHLKSMARSCC